MSRRAGAPNTYSGTRGKIGRSVKRTDAALAVEEIELDGLARDLPDAASVARWRIVRTFVRHASRAKVLDDKIMIEDGEAFEMSRQLALKEGLLVEVKYEDPERKLLADWIKVAPAQAE